MSTEHQGGRAAFRNLGSSQNKLDEEALKQQEILYTQVCVCVCVCVCVSAYLQT